MTILSAPLPTDSDPNAYDAALRWLIFTGLCLFAMVVLRQYGLVRLLATADRTHITAVIAGVYALASLNCFREALAIGREAGAVAALRRGARSWGRVGAHVDALRLKAAQRGGGRLDQTLLVYALRERLEQGLRFGALAGDISMKLGLLGTIVGFIAMLGPVARLDAADETATQSAMAVMSAGMATAMYATLAGLIGALLLKAQYGLVESAVNAVLADLIRLAETRLVPALERGDG